MIFFVIAFVLILNHRSSCRVIVWVNNVFFIFPSKYMEMSTFWFIDISIYLFQIFSFPCDYKIDLLVTESSFIDIFFHNLITITMNGNQLYFMQQTSILWFSFHLYTTTFPVTFIILISTVNTKKYLIIRCRIYFNIT